jgi:hypothetical protein
VLRTLRKRSFTGSYTSADEKRELQQRLIELRSSTIDQGNQALGVFGKMIAAQKQREVDYGRAVVAVNQAISELNTFLIREAARVADDRKVEGEFAVWWLQNNDVLQEAQYV